MPVSALLMAISVGIIWGANMLAVKIAVSDLPPMMLTAIRFGLVAVILVPFTRPPRHKLPAIALLALTFGVGHFALLVLGLRFLDAGMAAVLIELGVPFSALLAAAVFQDKLGWKRATGMTLSLVGVTVMSWDPGLAALRAPMLIILASAFMWAVGNIQIKKIGEIGVFALNGWMALFAAPQLFVLSLLIETAPIAAIGQAGPAAWAALSFTVLFSSILAYGLWYWLLKHHDVNQVVPFSLLAPPVAVVLGVLFMGETVTPLKTLGAVVVMIGVAIIVLRRPQTVKQGLE